MDDDEVVMTARILLHDLARAAVIQVVPVIIGDEPWDNLYANEQYEQNDLVEIVAKICFKAAIVAAIFEYNINLTISSRSWIFQLLVLVIHMFQWTVVSHNLLGYISGDSALWELGQQLKVFKYL